LWTRSIRFVEITYYPSWNLPFLIPAKAYPTVNPQNAKFVTALGNVCSATERLPISALLSDELERCSSIAVASGGLTDVWRGQYNSASVALKAFRIYDAQKLKEAKEVRLRSAREVWS